MDRKGNKCKSCGEGEGVLWEKRREYLRKGKKEKLALLE
jgi:hypothetical protein